MRRQIDGSWTGWSGDTIVQLTDGTVWRQDEYRYEYHYAYRPEVTITNGNAGRWHGSGRPRPSAALTTRRDRPVTTRSAERDWVSRLSPSLKRATRPPNSMYQFFHRLR